MKIAVVGSRNFTHKVILENELDSIKNQIELIISGGAVGADTLAENWAKENKIQTLIIKPNWKTYGRSAGVVRNKQIIESCDYCYAFWDCKSKGTEFSINYCIKISKEIKVIKFIPLVSN